MKILVIGGGGREHALVWKLGQSKMANRLWCAPGNGGIQEMAECVDISSSDIEGLSGFARKNAVDFTIVGPEQPLADGIVDLFRARGLAIFGPTKAAAKLEASKAYAKQFMRRHNIPTADFEIFENYDSARSFVSSLTPPIVIKADGLAAGKGAVVCNDIQAAETALEDMMVNARFGNAGSKVVVEEFLQGEELSVLAICDSSTILPLVPAQDHKAIYDGDKGPNTGGMGAFSPVPFADENFMFRVRSEILEPVVKGFRDEGVAYTGVLYAGLMATAAGPKVVEFNVRFGDPETQAILPLLDFDLLELLINSVEGKLPERPLPIHDAFSTCVVLASGGYPGDYEKGKRIRLDTGSMGENAVIFHAGTKRQGGEFYTTGGRVMGVTAWDKTLAGSIKQAYDAVKTIEFDNIYYRTDIGHKGLAG